MLTKTGTAFAQHFAVAVETTQDNTKGGMKLTKTHYKNKQKRRKENNKPEWLKVRSFY